MFSTCCGFWLDFSHAPNDPAAVWCEDNCWNLTLCLSYFNTRTAYNMTFCSWRSGKKGMTKVFIPRECNSNLITLITFILNKTSHCHLRMHRIRTSEVRVFYIARRKLFVSEFAAGCCNICSCGWQTLPDKQGRNVIRLREIKKPGRNPARAKSTHALCGSLCEAAAKGMMMGSGGSPTSHCGEPERTTFFRVIVLAALVFPHQVERWIIGSCLLPTVGCSPPLVFVASTSMSKVCLQPNVLRRNHKVWYRSGYKPDWWVTNNTLPFETENLRINLKIN